MNSELRSFHRRWHDATGEDMPHNIASLELAKIQRAVELVEAGNTVVVPIEPYPFVAVADSCGELSLQYWDQHNQH